MLITIVSTLSLTLAWMLISSHASWESFLIGLVAGLAITSLGRLRRIQLNARRLPDQFLALIIYVFELYRDIVLAGLDMARRVLSPNMGLNMGIIEISTQDEQRNPIVLALSANSITLPPGELVIEVAEDHLLYVHCLDVDISLTQLEPMQSRRIHLLKRIIGRDE